MIREPEIQRGFAREIANCSAEKKREILGKLAQEILSATEKILSANALDMDAAKGDISPVMLDRLRLEEGRVQAMAKGILEVAQLPDPVGVVLSQQTRPNGLLIEKKSVAMGTIGIIYESRPNVTSDAAALALMAGSACILRSGKEAHRTATAIVNAMVQGLVSCGLSPEVITLLEDTSRESAMALMQAKGVVDLLIPRGGKGLIATCVQNATVPVLETGTGICHGYVDKEADLELALAVIENAKVSRPSVCNAMEVCLIHKEIAKEFLPMLWHRLNPEGVSFRMTATCCAMLEEVTGESYSPASEEDFSTEFLDYILAVDVVSSVEEGISHINGHSTGHSEVILTQNQETADRFTREVDSAVVYVNASTRFTDGGEFGLGCEMGISTQKLHARGPVGLEELCAYHYVITGTGQVR
ncbi:MAG: glutamate-5-semialdehyde dehydrogenase [Eubacteriales bacterium]